MGNQDLPSESTSNPESTNTLENKDVLTMIPAFSSKSEMENSPALLNVDDGGLLNMYESPSNWQKKYHTYIKPENTGDSNFMICVQSATDKIFPQQSEPAVVS